MGYFEQIQKDPSTLVEGSFTVYFYTYLDWLQGDNLGR
ncbi:MAG: hypothetical protein ACI83D_000072 [Planctomycetota bacterium]|jgi:hypothetical protein